MTTKEQSIKQEKRYQHVSKWPLLGIPISRPFLFIHIQQPFLPIPSDLYYSSISCDLFYPYPYLVIFTTCPYPVTFLTHTQWPLPFTLIPWDYYSCPNLWKHGTTTSDTQDEERRGAAPWKQWMSTSTVRLTSWIQQSKQSKYPYRWPQLPIPVTLPPYPVTSTIHRHIQWPLLSIPIPSDLYCPSQYPVISTTHPHTQ